MNKNNLNIIENIEEIVAKSVPSKITKTYFIDDNVYGECPSCGHSGLKQGLHEYCFWCGQKVDWNNKKLEPLVIDL